MKINDYEAIYYIYIYVIITGYVITTRKKLNNDGFLPLCTLLDDGCPTVIEACVKKLSRTVFSCHEFMMYYPS